MYYIYIYIYTYTYICKYLYIFTLDLIQYLHQGQDCAFQEYYAHLFFTLLQFLFNRINKIVNT